MSFSENTLLRTILYEGILWFTSWSLSLRYAVISPSPRDGISSDLLTYRLTVDKKLRTDVYGIPFIAVAPDEYFRYALDLRDKGFDLLGESLLAVRKDDHGLDPARNVNTSLLVDKAHVSRMEPAVLVDGFFVIIVSEQLLYNSNLIKFN